MTICFRARARWTLLAAIAWVGSGACTREAAPDATREDAKAAGADAKSDSAAAPNDASSGDPAAGGDASLAMGLEDALTLGVVAPPAGGTTYRVDAFVPALVVAAVAKSGDRWFSPYAGTPQKVDYEVAGFETSAAAERAGLHRLGLRAGDIVEEINGVPARDPAQIEAALAGADRGLTVGVFREDYSFVLAYQFEPGLAWSRTLEARVPNVPGPPDVGADDEGGEPLAMADDGGQDPVDDGGDAGGGGAVGGGGGGASPPRGSGSTPRGSAKPSGGGALPPKTTTPKTTPGGGSGDAGAVSCTSASSCTIRRSYFDSMTSSMAKLESQATIVPAVRDDVFSGYKLKWVRPGSAVAQLGFRAGDKITHVNGKDLTDDAQALALYLGLSSTSTYKVRYVRGSSTATKTILVR